jgi:hypothetical protein
MHSVNRFLIVSTVSVIHDRHRDASRRRYPTPATPFVCELCDSALVLAVGPARVLVTNRHRGLRFARSKLKKHKPPCMR